MIASFRLKVAGHVHPKILFACVASKGAWEVGNQQIISSPESNDFLSRTLAFMDYFLQIWCVQDQMKYL